MEKLKAISMLEKLGGWATTGELKEAGLNHYHINRLLESGLLHRVGRGLYKWTDAPKDEKIGLARKIPQGVFCLFTACLHHDLSTFVPTELHLAVPQKSKYVLPGYPPVKLYYWDEKSWNTGIMEIKPGDIEIRMYDMEKTVCDILRLRNKVGLDLTKEVVKSYLAKKERDLVKLMSYARLLRIEKVVRNYLEIML